MGMFAVHICQGSNTDTGLKMYGDSIILNVVIISVQSLNSKHSYERNLEN
jgi:hypothetical protein